MLCKESVHLLPLQRHFGLSCTLKDLTHMLHNFTQKFFIHIFFISKNAFIHPIQAKCFFFIFLHHHRTTFSILTVSLSSVKWEECFKLVCLR